MATVEQLVEAVRESLERDGTLAKMKAEVRSNVMNILGVNGMAEMNKPLLPPEVGLINELIKEYLSWIGYSYTRSILEAESSSPLDKKMNRKEIQAELEIGETHVEDNMPLLFTLISEIKSRKLQNLH